MKHDERYHCRRCRLKLAAPVSNPLSAFCCRGCFRIFFKSICIICEGKKSGQGMACKMPKCQSDWAHKRLAKTRGRYLDSFPSEVASETPISIGLESGIRHVAGPALSAVEIKALKSYWPEAQDGFTPEQRASAKRMRHSEYTQHCWGT